MGHHVVSTTLFIVVFLILTLVAGGSANAQQATLTGNENQSISLSSAVELVKNYQATAPAGTPWGFFFGSKAIQSVLAQPECMGVRIYLAKKDNGELTLVVVGVDSKNSDMTAGTLIDSSPPCPPFCDTLHTIGR